MMKLHVFNPDHDVALACDTDAFTAPHAARELRADLSYLPALWADDGDMVLVDDVASALESVRHLGRFAHDVLFISHVDLARVPIDFSTVKVVPWGWDRALCHCLVSSNATFRHSVPTSGQLESMRRLSSRMFAATHLLPVLAASHDRFVGTSTFFSGDAAQLADRLMADGGRFVLKAPWSSSGRGLRYVDHDFSGHVEGWCRNLIKKQGGVMIEPQYNKVCDFGMEFMAMDNGSVSYLGLSLFSTVHGAYTGNIIASEAVKRNMMARYVPLELLDFIQEHVISLAGSLFKGKYVGPFGIDMMVVRVEGREELCIHPCVELNLRRTMGHVALALTEPKSTAPKQIMHVERTDKYRLKVSLAGDDVLIPYVL